MNVELSNHQTTCCLKYQFLLEDQYGEETTLGGLGPPHCSDVQ